MKARTQGFFIQEISVPICFFLRHKKEIYYSVNGWTLQKYVQSVQDNPTIGFLHDP
jgi:hypothetical protein